MQVKVQAGTRVQDLADQLRPHGLTLQNYASIREQTIGGFTQVWDLPACLAISPAVPNVLVYAEPQSKFCCLPIQHCIEWALIEMCQIGFTF